MKHNFEFDPQKSNSNKKKHGIDFVESQTLWGDPFLVELKSRPGMEERFLAIGMIKGLIWTSIYTKRFSENDDKPKIRIISVRRARENERKFYYANN